MATLKINGETRNVDAEPNMPLLWVIREQLKLTGTKFGCGIAQCGACTVHVDGEPVRSCSYPVSRAEGAEITTIEAIAPSEDELHALQQAWIDHQVPQCGYCQSGQIMQAASLLESDPNPSDETIDAVMSGNLCRCGTYPRIRAAIRLAQAKMGA